MMIKYFAIYDEKAQLFGQLFPSHTMGSAQRSFQELINNPDTPQAKFPADFTLYSIFDFDDTTGQIIESYVPPVHVCRATDLISQS
ncbi:MAG: nonstructural protein [Microvirus sp.]|nr:MAG: nonstructural protein [Microvirus sp.]